MLAHLNAWYLTNLSPQRAYARTIYQLTGLRPRSLAIYRQAFRHASASHSGSESNERLEFLGDAVLGTVVADFLFRAFPRRSEGYLTEMRSRMVSRLALNDLGRRMGLRELLEYRHETGRLNGSATGNALEAFIGAVYLDQGYERCRRFIIRQLVQPYFDLEALEQNDLNFKSQLLRWVQMRRLPHPQFVVVERRYDPEPCFVVACQLDNQVVGTGSDRNKKGAEQKAALDAFARLTAADSPFEPSEALS
jgi:ribonuclease-3